MRRVVPSTTKWQEKMKIEIKMGWRLWFSGHRSVRQCLVSTDNLWKWWMLNWPIWRAETNGECQARQIWKNGECPIDLNLESGNLGQWWMSKSETMVNVSGQSIGYVTAITRFDCKKYDVNSMSSGVNIKNTMNNPVLKSSIRTFFCKILPPNQKWEKGFWPNIFISFGTGPPHIYKGFTNGKIQKIHYGP